MEATLETSDRNTNCVLDCALKLKSGSRQEIVDGLNDVVRHQLENSYSFSGPGIILFGTELLQLAAHKKSNDIRKLASQSVTRMFDDLPGEVKCHFISHYLVGKDDKCGLSDQAKWKTKILSLQLIDTAAKSNPTLVAVLMPQLVPVVSDLMWDTKQQVKEKAEETMEVISGTIDNIDLKPFVPELIDAITDPENVSECVYALAGTTFVKTVTASALSMTVPLLARGFKERNTVIIRKCAVITENLAKLVKNANDAKPFLPILCPALEKGLETISDPECRERFAKANEILQKIKSRMTDTVSLTRGEVVSFLEDGGDRDVQANKRILSTFAADMIVDLANTYGGDECVWNNVLESVFSDLYGSMNKTSMVKKCFEKFAKTSSNLENTTEDDTVDSEDDGAEVICDIQFSLAYGSNILLNDSRLHIKKGHKYGIIANKSAGKTTLMRAISNGQIEGFPLPTDVRTVFIENDIQGAQLEMNVVEFVRDTVGSVGLTDDVVSEHDIRTMLKDIGFTDQMINGPITSLSGGWKMKLALGRATLQKADIMLMDEPTNHLDVLNVQWVVDYLNSLPEVTCLIVSHDTAFLDKTVNHIIHFENLKLHTYRGNVSSFVEKVPEAKSYFQLESSSLKFTFPKPTALQTGSKQSNKGRTLLQMKGVHFTYPSAVKPQLINVNVKASMASRVAIVGANGAGKSTLIKLLTGEMEPSKGEVKKHPNCRFAYVAQHAFHHIEQHLDKSPNKYICWRYESGEDKEEQNKATIDVTDEEQQVMDAPWNVSWKDSSGELKREKRVVEKLMARRKVKKTFEYEVRWKNKSMDYNIWYSRDVLCKKGFTKMVTAIDTRVAAIESMNHRPLTQKNVTAHLAAVGLEEEFANHSRIRDLSGGQKVKVVLAACTWACPHLIILDEPTNYLDRDSLGALANAIKDFEGGIVLITHNKEFADLTTRETWVVANNMCDVKGDPEWEKYAAEQHCAVEETETTDAYGNKIEIKKKPKKIEEMTRKELKKVKKEMKEKVKRGDELETHELIWAEHLNLL